MAYAAKSQSFAATGLLNLNTVASADDLLPLLESFPNRAERQSVADGTFEFLQRKRPLANIGALAPLRRSQKFPLARLKPLMIVRTPDEFRNELLTSAGIFFAGVLLRRVRLVARALRRRPRALARAAPALPAWA